ncbi:MAG: formylglycine-generating enzyme family protein [Phycisphaerae bacterium]
MKKFIVLLFFPLIIGCDEPKNLGPRTPATPEQAKSMQAEAAAQNGIPAEKTVEIANGVTMEFVLIPAGEFYMGSPSNEAWRESIEGPVHYVKISKPFYMGKYEVTQKQYESVVGPNPKTEFKGDEQPIENVEWYQAVTFCNAVSNKIGAKVRLPSEAEWEYACRAGTQTAFNTGEIINPDQANYDCDRSYKGSRTTSPPGRTCKVGSYPPNAFGLYDMHGNVSEWCQDIFKNDYYKKSPTTNPCNDGLKGSRIVRGGAWCHSPVMLRSAERSKRIQGADRKFLGFRVVMEAER